MTDLVGELRSRRLVREMPPVRRPGAGRPTRPIALDGEPWCVLGMHIDIDQVEFSGTTVGGRELWQDTIDVDLRGADHPLQTALLDLLRTQLQQMPADKSLIALQVGVPGFVGSDRCTVGRSEDLGWRDLPLGLMISRALAGLGQPRVHVAVANDSHLAALRAARLELALPAVSVVVYFGGRRDVGSAIIVDGEIFRGAGGGAGDFVHLNVDPFGPADRCGRRGCLESLIGPRQLLVTGHLRSAAEADRLVSQNPDHAVQIIANAADGGDPAVLATLARAGVGLGRAIDDVIGIVNPDAVLLGGYLADLSRHLTAQIDLGIADRVRIAPFEHTNVLALGRDSRRAVAGATLAARDACLYDPLTWTRSLA